MPPPARVFRSPEAAARQAAWYDRFLTAVPGPHDRRHVPTRFGPSHVLAAGDPAGPPLVALHGSLAGSAHLLGELAPLLARFRVYAPDLPGQSAHGPPARPDYADGTVPGWLGEVLDGLGLTAPVDLFGVSLGGFYAHRLAAAAPARVRRLALLLPAGVANGSAWAGFTRVFLPLARYRLRPTDRNLRRLYAGLFTDWDDVWGPWLGDAMRDFALDLRIPPLATPAALAGYAGPALVFGADGDVSFPGAKLVARARELLPQAETELLVGCKHGPPTTPEFRHQLAARLAGFFAGPG